MCKLQTECPNSCKNIFFNLVSLGGSISNSNLLQQVERRSSERYYQLVQPASLIWMRNNNIRKNVYTLHGMGLLEIGWAVENFLPWHFVPLRQGALTEPITYYNYRYVGYTYYSWKSEELFPKHFSSTTNACEFLSGTWEPAQKEAEFKNLTMVVVN